MSLAASRVVFALSGLVVNLAAARVLTREEFGVWRWLWAIVALMTFGSNLGLFALVTRVAARSPGQASALLPGVLRLTVGLSGFTGAGIVGYVAWRDGRPEVLFAAVLAALTLGLQALTQIVEGMAHGLGRTHLEVPAVLGGRGLIVVGSLVALATGAGLGELFGVRVAGQGVTLLVLWWALRRRLAPPEGDGMPPAALLSEGRAFGATVLFGAVSAQADILLLEALRGDEEVARYAAPASVLLQLALFSTVISRSFFPLLARLKDRPTDAVEVLGLQLRTLLLASLPVAVGGALLAPRLVPWVFGEPYADAVLPFLLLVLVVPVRFLHSGLALTLTAFDRQTHRARLDAGVAATNVAANLLVIPRFGAEGAALTTLATDLLLLALMSGQVRPVVGHLTLGIPVWRAVAPVVVMGLAVAVTPSSVPVPVVVLGGALIYAVAVRGMAVWTPEDRRRLAAL